MLGVAIFLDTHNSGLIQQLFPFRVPIPDTLFDLLPYWPRLQFLSDFAQITSVLALALYLFPRRWRELPFALSVLGLSYLARSILILMNPFGGPLGTIVHYGMTTIHQFGEFPSGHTILVTCIFFLIEKSRAPQLYWIALGSLWLEVLSLLLSHGHYTVDVVGGFLVAYFCYTKLAPVKGQLLLPKNGLAH